MKVIYQGKDITEDVDVSKCLFSDYSGGRRDILDIEFEYSNKWFGWKPEKDDTIQIEHDGFDTGKLYVNSILPEGGRYRILATAAKSAARNKVWASYDDTTLNALMGICAAECGMEHGLYGISGGLNYFYITRENQDGMAFLDRLLTMEGGRLKCQNGKLRGIGIEYAQGLTAGQTFEIDTTQMQARYTHREDLKYAGITVKTPYAEATAYDSSVKDGNHPVINHLPASDNAQAGRWARGMLLNHNRTAEELELGMEFNAGLTALVRVNIESDTDANGEWIVDQVEHDFITLKSTAVLYRCITTIR